MGGKYRLKVSIIGALALQGAVACSRSDVDEHRRQLLEAAPRAEAREERISKLRVIDPQGDLLPSENKVAGYVIPRGFVLTRTLPHRWIYDAELPPDKVEAYFDKRLAGGTKSRKEGPEFEVEWLHSIEKTDPNAVPGWIQIMLTPSKREWTRIIVSEPNPPPPGGPPLVDVHKMAEIIAEQRRTAR